MKNFLVAILLNRPVLINSIVKVLKDILLKNIDLDFEKVSQTVLWRILSHEKQKELRSLIHQMRKSKVLCDIFFGQSLALCVGDFWKGSKDMNNAFETTHELTKLIKKSSKWDA